MHRRQAPLGNPKRTTYKQRWFDNQQWWATNKDGTRGPIFFYFGNEDNVELYVNHTGLMWESYVHSDHRTLALFRLLPCPVRPLLTIPGC